MSDAFWENGYIPHFETSALLVSKRGLVAGHGQLWRGDVGDQIQVSLANASRLVGNPDYRRGGD
jgi:hypothetical protein